MPNWGSAEGRFVLRVPTVQRAIRELQPLRTHELMPMYLHLRHQAVEQGRYSRLSPEWQGEPREWMDVPGGPANKPFFRPFRSRGSSPDGLWLNANLAGSYSPSSPRGISTLFLNEEGEYSVPTRDDGTPDAEPIRHRLLRDQAVPAWAVAAFIYRNRSFLVEGPGVPNGSDLLAVFQESFKWTDSERQSLFTWTLPENLDFFEEWTADA